MKAWLARYWFAVLVGALAGLLAGCLGSYVLWNLLWASYSVPTP